MDEFTRLQLTENEFNNLVFMGPPRWWTDEKEYPPGCDPEKTPKPPVREGDRFLASLGFKPLQHVAQKVIERSGLDRQNLNPTKVFENIDIIARYDKEPWFKQHVHISQHFHKSLMTPIFIRNLTPCERKQPSQTFYVEDGNHRVLVYAVHIACGATTYESVKAIHATSWQPAKIFDHPVQSAPALEHNGKLQKSGRSGRMEAITLAEVYYHLGNTHHRAGDAHHNEGDYDQAIKAFTKAIEKKPDYPEAYTNRGIDYVKKRNYELAIADHNKAIELNQDSAEAYFNRGGAYKSKGDDCQNQGDYNRAIADFTKAIELKPDFLGAYNHRGVAYRAKGEYDNAIKDFNKALKPDFIAEVYNNLGITYRKKGEIDRAIEYHNKAIECKPDFGSAYYNRGLARLLLRECEKARLDLTTATEKGANIVNEFRMDYESVSDFEGRHGIQLPTDIAAMLTPQ